MSYVYTHVKTFSSTSGPMVTVGLRHAEKVGFVPARRCQVNPGARRTVLIRVRRPVHGRGAARRSGASAFRGRHQCPYLGNAVVTNISKPCSPRKLEDIITHPLYDAIIKPLLALQSLHDAEAAATCSCAQVDAHEEPPS